MLSFLESILEVTVGVILADQIVKHAPAIKAKTVELAAKVKSNKNEEPVAA